MRLSHQVAVALGIIAAGSSATFAQDAPLSWGSLRTVSGAEAAAVRSLIEGQIAALKRNDADGAYAAAADTVRRRFPTAAGFMAMARVNYGPLFADRGLHFGGLRAAGGTATQGDTFSQSVDMADGKGGAVTAVFGLERQPDGQLKITSCVLIPRRPGSA